MAGDGREKERIPHPHSHPGPWPQEPFPRSRAREHGRPPGGFLRHKGPAEWVVSEGRRAEVHREQVEGRRAEVHREQVEVRRAEVHREQVEGRRAEVHREQGDVFKGVRNSLSSPSCSEADRVNREGFGRRGSRAEGHPNLKLNQSGDASGDGEEGYVNNLKYENGAGDGLDMREDDASTEQDVLADQIMDSATLKEDSHAKQVKKRSNSWRGKDLRTDSNRGHHVSSQRMRIHRRATQCRYGIGNFTSSFLSIYKSLVPEQEEKEKQKQLLLMLEKLVVKEWPKAQLHVYGSCANSFGFSNSDIDICLAIDDINMSKSDILLKLADILQEDNLENVQALTHARVPIVKMMDPVTGISCDICVNNLLAVVNTKLLRDYAQIDRRLPQLAFIVKHWAKSRGVNETYRGTLSSYAYVLMCIHFLQQRRPAILPCLQEMEATYVVTVDDTRCAYFDRVEELRDFGVQNKDNISQLLWGFFHYWAYYHDYTSDVISVRTGRLISKQSKDWTRRIGNDRHLICIEDPFEISHDLGRVVDKFTIKILREEFERAADILQYDPNPGLILFEPYVPGPTHD